MTDTELWDYVERRHLYLLPPRPDGTARKPEWVARTVGGTLDSNPVVGAGATAKEAVLDAARQDGEARKTKKIDRLISRTIEDSREILSALE